MPKRRVTGVVNIRTQQRILKHQLDLLRLEASTRRRAYNSLSAMMNDVLGQLTERDITRFKKDRLNSLLSQAADTIERYYARIHTLAGDTLKGVADNQSRFTMKLLNDTYTSIDLGASLPTEAMLARLASDSLIMGATSGEWWARQARDTAFRFSTEVRQGLLSGDTTEQIAARVAGRQGFPGIMEVSRKNARSLVHTSIMEVSNESRMATFKENDDVVKGIRQVSTLDSHTTEICMAYDGAEFDLDGNPINGTTLPFNGGVPRHWGCRSVEVPITLTFKELGINAPEPTSGTRASEDGQVPAKWTFSDFLESMTKEEQDEALGAGRAELWRNGDITLQQLLDQKGNPLTLKELQRKYG